MEEKAIEMREFFSRRDFLVKAGALTTGVAIAGGLLGASSEQADAAAAIPIPFQKLDVESVRKYGFEGYKTGGGCMYGAAFGLLKAFQSQPGADPRWNNLDYTLFKYGAGGVNSWGTICGALNGALYIMSLAVGWDTTIWKASGDKGATLTKYGNELMSWYCQFSFPSPTLIAGTASKPIPTASNDPRAISAKVTSVSGSPLCHASVSTWCKASGKGVASPEKSDRCARLTGDVAAKAATLLNQYLSNYIPIAVNTNETNYCMSCHAPSNVPSNQGYQFPNNKDDEQGKMPCVECHTDEAAHRSMMSDENADDCGNCHTY